MPCERQLRYVLEKASSYSGTSTDATIKLPAGRLKRVEAWNSNNSVTVNYIYLYDSITDTRAAKLVSKQDLDAGEVVAWEGDLEIPTGWRVKAQFINGTAADKVNIGVLIESESGGC